MRKKFRYISLKRDMFGFGSAVGGAFQAGASIYAADQANEAAHFASNKSYEGALATNAAQERIANELNETNIRNTQATNAANLQIQRETNEANLRLAQQQNQWNLEQWQRENEYNSPVHQVQLYREAGLNPAMLASGNTWSPAQQVSSADMANQQAAVMQVPQATHMPNLQNPASGAAELLYKGAADSAKYMNEAVSKGISAASGISEAIKNSASAKFAHKQSAADLDKTVQSVLDMKFKNEFLNSVALSEKWANLKLIQNNADYIYRKIGIADNEKRLSAYKADMAEIELSIQRFGYQYLRDMPFQLWRKAVNEAQLGFETWQQQHYNTKFLGEHGMLPSDYASLRAAIFAATTSLEGAKYSADKSFQSSVYGSNQNYLGTVYSSNASSSAARYSANKSFEASKYSSDINMKIADKNNIRGWFSTIATGVGAAGLMFLNKGKFTTLMDGIRNLERTRKSKLLEYNKQHMPTQPFN